MSVDNRKPTEYCAQCDAHFWPAQLFFHATHERVANKPEVPTPVANTDKIAVANRHGKYKDPAKRREYMRAYMIRWRASTKTVRDNA